MYQAIQTPSPVQGLTRDPGELTPVLGLRQTAPPSLTAGGAGGFHQGSPSGELNWVRKKGCSYPWVRRNGAGSMTPASSSRPLLTQHTERNWLNAEIVESCEGVRVRPARSSADVCQRGAVATTHGRRQHSWWSEPSPPGGTAHLATGTPRRRPPLSSGPTSVWRQPSLSAAHMCHMRNALTGHSNAKVESASSEGSACRFTT